MSIVAHPKFFARSNEGCIYHRIQAGRIAEDKGQASEPSMRGSSAPGDGYDLETQFLSFTLTKPGVKERNWVVLLVVKSAPSDATACGTRGALLDLNRGHFSSGQILARGCP